MSTETVETILSRAISDSKFADQLFANPEQVLAGFELTTEEVSNLKGLSRVEFDKAAQSSPEERKSFFRIAVNHNETVLRLC